MMDGILQVIGKFQYPPKNQTYARFITMFVWLGFVFSELAGTHSVPCNQGLCWFLNCNFLISPPYSWLFGLFVIVLAVLYVFEKYMQITTALLAIAGMLVFSVAISEGSRPRFEVLSMVLIAQFIAYSHYKLMGPRFKATTTPGNLAMFYSIQIIGSCYMISAICKMQASGITWVMDSPNVALRVIASFTARGLDFGMPALIPLGRNIAAFVTRFPWLIRTGFAMVFCIEFFALMATISRRWARKYGFLLLLMHLFMLIVMGIVIIPFVLLVVAYLVNFSESNEAPEKDEDTRTTIQRIAFRLALPAIFIPLSIVIGEQHPFSRFPMFSTMDNFARYYWVQDQNGHALSARKCFGTRSDQFKNLISDRAMVQHKNLRDSEGLRPICQPLMELLVKAHLPGLRAQNINEVKLMDHVLWMDNGEIREKDIVLADVKVESAPE